MNVHPYALATTHDVADFTPWWIATCRLPRLPLGRWRGHDDVVGTGCSIDKRVSIRSAVGESIERYCGIQAWQLDHAELLSHPASALAQTLPRCSADEDVPCGFNDTTTLNRISHSVMTRCDTGERIWIPSSLVHLGYEPMPDEGVWSLPDSNGLASGRDRFATVWRATREVVERDAFTLRWLCHQTPPAIDTTRGDVPWLVRLRLESLDILHISVDLYLLTIDVPVPVVACVTESLDYPRLAVGLGASSTIGDAAAKAIDESVGVRIALMTNMEEHFRSDVTRQRDDPSGASWVKTFHDHARYYAMESNTQHLRRVFPRTINAAVTIDFSALDQREWLRDPVDAAELRKNVDMLRELGLTVLSRELTTTDVGNGWLVYRVVIPEAMPLPQGVRFRWLATPRLRLHSSIWGRDLRDANKAPHPFA